LSASGPQSARILPLWHYQITVSVVVFVLVVGAMLVGAWRAQRNVIEDPMAVPPATRGPLTRTVAWATAATVVLLFIYLVIDFRTGAAYTRVPTAKPLEIQLIGHQWWWEVRYPDSVPQNVVTTANEIHIPVGKPVLFRVTSSDVIHSVWIPNLGGKKDLIPGYVRTAWFQADTAGIYRGQCAEFCGYQHAKMMLYVIAEPPEKFSTWLSAQRQPAPTPTDSLVAKGGRVFMASACIMCHSITGTPAGGQSAPDLTHVASRMTIAAGALPNTTGNLAGWIIDPQRIKPGALMPPNQIQPRDLQALLAYLQSLR
jgi:cytochrome c oxidase subunit 2